MDHGESDILLPEDYLNIPQSPQQEYFITIGQGLGETVNSFSNNDNDSSNPDVSLNSGKLSISSPRSDTISESESELTITEDNEEVADDFADFKQLVQKIVQSEIQSSANCKLSTFGNSHEKDDICASQNKLAGNLCWTEQMKQSKFDSEEEFKKHLLLVHDDFCPEHSLLMRKSTSKESSKSERIMRKLIVILKEEDFNSFENVKFLIQDLLRQYRPCPSSQSTPESGAESNLGKEANFQTQSCNRSGIVITDITGLEDVGISDSLRLEAKNQHSKNFISSRQSCVVSSGQNRKELGPNSEKNSQNPKGLETKSEKLNNLIEVSVKNCDELLHCPYECSFSSYSKTSLQTHVLYVHEGKQGEFMCNICGKRLTTNHSLKIHVKTTHKDSEDTKFVCHLCGKTFRHNYLLGAHLRLTHADNCIKCDVSECGKTFKSKEHLRLHNERVHRKVKRCKCEYEGCGEEFYRRSRLNEHIAVHHTREKHYPCTWRGCTKSFRAPYHLKVHMRIHNDTKPFKCQHCSYAARQKHALNMHLRKHTSTSVQYKSETVNEEPLIGGSFVSAEKISFIDVSYNV